jgi:hypothetical protein
MTPYTPSDAEIEAACVAYVGLPGIDAEREWSRYSSPSQAAIRQQMRRALIAAATARTNEQRERVGT